MSATLLHCKLTQPPFQGPLLLDPWSERGRVGEDPTKLKVPYAPSPPQGCVVGGDFVRAKIEFSRTRAHTKGKEGMFPPIAIY